MFPVAVASLRAGTSNRHFLQSPQVLVSPPLQELSCAAPSKFISDRNSAVTNTNINTADRLSFLEGLSHHIQGGEGQQSNRAMMASLMQSDEGGSWFWSRTAYSNSSRSQCAGKDRRGLVPCVDWTDDNSHDYLGTFEEITAARCCAPTGHSNSPNRQAPILRCQSPH